MTIRFPDVSNRNPGYTIPANTPVVIAKASEGRTYADYLYDTFKRQASNIGAFFIAYHWLWPSNTTEQARHAFGIVGSETPLMLDVEELSQVVTVDDIIGFVNFYRSLGGKVTLLYLPHWYWMDHMRAPSLTRLADLGLKLVASNYRQYDENNWPLGYGGMEVVQWQYTDAPVDMNAFRGSVADYKALVLGGSEMASSDEILAAVHDVLRRVTNIDEAYMFGGVVGDGKSSLPETVTYTAPDNTKHSAPFALGVELHALRAKLEGLAGASGGLTDADRTLIGALTDSLNAVAAHLR